MEAVIRGSLASPKSRIAWPLRGPLALAGAALAIVALSGCAPMTISGHTSGQLDEIGDVQLVTDFCTSPTNPGTTCGPFPAGANVPNVVKLGYTIPDAAQAPEQFSTVSGLQLTFTRDPTYTPGIPGVNVPEGRRWVGYSSNSFTYSGAAESARVAPRFGLPQGADGAPWEGGFAHSVTVQSSSPAGNMAPSTASADQSTRDLGVIPEQASVPAGDVASVPFNLRYAGPAGAGPFALEATTDVPGASAAPEVASVTPAADSDNPVSVEVEVPPGASPGNYDVTLTASLPNGQTRTGTATLTVTPFVPLVDEIAAGFTHTCAILHDGRVRCWGLNFSGQLGLGHTNPVGLTPETLPHTVPPVDLGPGRTAVQISAGINHTCALLDNAQVLCWGSGAGGALGQGDQQNVGDDETPGSAGPVDLGGGHTAVAVSAGGSDSCAILDDGSVKCWGAGTVGKLGYGNTTNVQDPSTVGPVSLGAGRTAVAIDAAADHTCAILSTGEVMCWGNNFAGKLGYGFGDSELEAIGDDETPDTFGTIDLGGHSALQVTSGDHFTCALLDDHTARCWGSGFRGLNGYPGSNDFHSPPAQPIDFGPGRTVLQIEAAADHACAVLDDHTLRCWGFGNDGRLGYANTADIGDNETPGSAGPVDIGPGRTADAASAGSFHSCALMDDGEVRCWGDGQFLGYGSTTDVGDNETPGTAGPVSLGD